MKQAIRRTVVIIALAVFTVGVVGPAGVFAVSERALAAQTAAEERRAATEDRRSQASDAGEEAVTMQATGVDDKKEVAKAKRAAAQQKLCERREQNVRKIMSKMSERGGRQLELFTKISDRTQVFYAEAGNVLVNYGTLVDEVDAAKERAITVVSEVQAQSESFTCNLEDPKAAIEDFRAAIKQQNEALKAYKTRVKDLIVGVKSVQPETVEEGAGSDQ